MINPDADCLEDPGEIQIRKDVEKIMIHPDTIFITGANQGLGFDLITHILSQPETPSFLFAGCKYPSISDRRFLRALAVEHDCLKIVNLDETKDGDIKAALLFAETIMGDTKGLNLLINNAGVTDTTWSGQAAETTETMRGHFDTNAIGKNQQYLVQSMIGNSVNISRKQNFFEYIHIFH